MQCINGSLGEGERGKQARATQSVRKPLSRTGRASVIDATWRIPPTECIIYSMGALRSDMLPSSARACLRRLLGFKMLTNSKVETKLTEHMSRLLYAVLLFIVAREMRHSPRCRLLSQRAARDLRRERACAVCIVTSSARRLHSVTSCRQKSMAGSTSPDLRRLSKGRPSEGG
jgi:hypothetical protein